MSAGPSRSGFVGWRVTIRQLLASPAVAATTFATVAVTGLFIIGAPQFLEVLSRQALNEIVSAADPGVRNIGVFRATTIPVLSGETPFHRVEAFGSEFRDREFGPNSSLLVQRFEHVIDSPRFELQTGPDGPFEEQAFIRLRHQSGVQDKVRLIEGHMPAEREPALGLSGSECDPFFASEGERRDPPELRSPQIAVDCQVIEIPLFEAAFSAESLEEMGLDVGDRVSVSPDPTDVVAYINVPRNMLEYEIFVEVSGVISPVDAGEEYWYGDVALHRPRLVETPDFEIVHATGLAASEAYLSMLQSVPHANWQYAWRYFVDIEQLEPESMPAVQAELRALQAGFPSASQFAPGQSAVSTGLPDLIETFFDQRRLAYSTLGMSGAGLFVTSIAIVLLMAALVSVREESSLILLRSRGGTAPQLLGARSVQGFLLIAPAVTLSYLITRIATPGNSEVGEVAAVALAGTTLAAFVAAVVPFNRVSLGQLLSRGSRPPKGSARRIVGETLVVVAAIAATLLLRRRFLADSNDSEAPFDVLLSLAPVALGIAVGIVALRSTRIPIRGLTLLASRRRSPVLFVGLRRVLHLPTVARLPLIAVVAAVALSVFSMIISESINEGQVESTFHTVGADFSVTARAPGDQLSGDYGLVELDSVTALARAARLRGESMVIEETETDSHSLELIALEVEQYQNATKYTQADRDLPIVLLTDRVVETSPIPALVSSNWPGGARPGTTFTSSVGGPGEAFMVVGTLERFPGTGEAPFAVVDIGVLESVLGRQLPITDLYVAAPPEAAASIRTAVTSRSSNAIVMSQTEELERLRSSPFVSGIIYALLVATGLAVLLGVVAAIGSLALTGPERRRDLGYLRTLGLSPRQAMGITALEQIPTITFAAVLGGLLGVALAVVFEPGLDLAALTGPGVGKAIRLQPLSIAIITVLVIGALVTAVVVFVVMARRRNLGQLLRMGDE